MEFYPNTDPLIPGTCKLTTTCKTYYEDMPPITGNYYLPMLTLINNVRNINGTLYEWDGTALGKSKESEPLVDADAGPNLWHSEAWRPFIDRSKLQGEVSKPR